MGARTYVVRLATCVHTCTWTIDSTSGSTGNAAGWSSRVAAYPSSPFFHALPSSDATGIARIWLAGDRCLHAHATALLATAASDRPGSRGVVPAVFASSSCVDRGMECATISPGRSSTATYFSPMTIYSIGRNQRTNRSMEYEFVSASPFIRIRHNAARRAHTAITAIHVGVCIGAGGVRRCVCKRPKHTSHASSNAWRDCCHCKTASYAAARYTGSHAVSSGGVSCLGIVSQDTVGVADQKASYSRTKLVRACTLMAGSSATLAEDGYKAPPRAFFTLCASEPVMTSQPRL